MSSSGSRLFVSDRDRWQAVVDRDPKAEGRFVYAVKTTGIYCRPTCASRKPNRENVEFFETWKAAEAAGYRPCKRCQPFLAMSEQDRAAMMTRICQRIQNSEAPLSLQELAEAAGLSRYHFQRQFKKWVGVSPKQYAIAHRAHRVRQQLQEPTTVTDAIYAAGFTSGSSFYEQANGLLGMTPTDYRQGATGVEIRYSIHPCWLGQVLIAATPKGLCTIALGDTADALMAQLRQDFPNAKLSRDREYQSWVQQVLEAIETPQSVNLPLDVRGTAFQRLVWQSLQTIPPGTTLSYGEVARRMDNPKAVRAVARACATNPLAVVVPCHRVIGQDGSLRGYRWGCDRKRALLDREAVLHVAATRSGVADPFLQHRLAEDSKPMCSHDLVP